MTISLDALIHDVEVRSPSPEPLELLATASATVQDLSETSDALLSHFVDRSRRAGHSWSEIGEALGVTKQAVQKRFTGEKQWLRGAQLLTPRAKAVLTDRAEEAAKELRTAASISTEALLLALWGESKGLAAKLLKDQGVTKPKTVAAIRKIVPGTEQDFVGGYTPRAWRVMESLVAISASLGHNYIGTEHVLIGLLSGDSETVAARALDALGVSIEAVVDGLKKVLNGLST